MLQVPSRASFIAPSLDFLAGGGEMGRRIREKDFSGTPLGPTRDWPASLRSAVRVLLASRQPLALWWGVECTLLYNDACRPLLGSSADSALGMPAPSAWLAGNSQISAIVGEGANCREGHFALSAERRSPHARGEGREAEL